MKKVFVLLVLALILVLSSQSFSQTKFIFYSNSWSDCDDVSGYNNVKFVFDLGKQTYYKVIEGQKNPTYNIKSSKSGKYNGLPYLIVNFWSGDGAVKQIVIMNGNVGEYFWSGFWQVFYCYDYDSY